MHNRIPSRRRASAPQAKGKEGNTAAVQAPRTEPAPRMPHEHDESADSQAAADPTARRMGNLAREDVERGVVDTDKGPVLDETYEKYREDSTDPLKKIAP